MVIDNLKIMTLKIEYRAKQNKKMYIISVW